MGAVEAKPLDKQRFKELLDDQHAFPGRYTFKFIAGRDELASVLALLPEETPVIRPSSRSNYVAVTFEVDVPSSDAVVAVYERAARIDKLISL
jgi:putative lipoic acid-binding regulatory protein